MAYHSAITEKNDFLLDVSRGKVGDYRILNFSGANPDIDADVEEDLWPKGGTLDYLTTAETMEIESTDAADTDPLVIFISGLDGDYLEVSESITLDGLTKVTTTQEFLRVNFMFLSGAGTTNAGIITATASISLDTQCSMAPGKAISQHGFFTIPAGKQGIMAQVEMNAAKLSGGGIPILEFVIYARFVPTAPWVAILSRRIDTSVQDSLIIPLPVSPIFTPRADIRLAATSDVTNTVASMRVTGVIYDV